MSILTGLLLLASETIQKNNDDNAQGFSLVEMIVSTVMGMIIVGVAFGGFIIMRQTFLLDKGSADVNQRLKTILATIGPDMQQLGQGLTGTSLPLVKLEVNTTPVKSSVITTTKVIIAKALSPKNPLAKNTSSTTIEVNEDVLTLEEWKNARINNGGKITATIINSAGQQQFFDYTGEDFTTDPNVRTINISSTTWNDDYNASSSIYLMEKRRYEVKDNTLTLTVNDNTADSLKLVEDVEKLDIVATIESRDSDTTFLSECKGIPDTGTPITPTNCGTTPTPINYKFQNIRSIDVKATVKQKQYGYQKKKLREEDLTMSQKFFPRNTIN